MSFAHGSKARFYMGTTASPNIPVDVSQYVTSVTFPQSIDTAETSVVGNVSKNYVPGLTASTVSVEGIFDPAIDNTIYNLYGQVVTVAYYPQGTANGAPVYTVSGFFTAYQGATPETAAGTFTLTLQISSAIVRTVVGSSNLAVTNNGDGTYTLSGSAVTDNGDGTYSVNDPSVVSNGDGTYSIAY